MKLKRLNENHYVCDQLDASDLGRLADQGIRTIINNRPDGEQSEQPTSEELEQAARAVGLEYVHAPVVSQALTYEELEANKRALSAASKPVCGFCRTGTRGAIAWGLASAESEQAEVIVQTVAEAGFSTEALEKQLGQLQKQPHKEPKLCNKKYDVLIIGGGAAGISAAASIHKRANKLSIAIIEPSDVHRYQPGLTMVGGGIFKDRQISRSMRSVMPSFVSWIKQEASSFNPTANEVVLNNNEIISYETLVVAPGLMLHWEGIEGLQEALGSNGVTSNYAPEHAAYTWEIVSGLRAGRAVFSQPPMPIKCAGAPQKAVYLSCHAWERTNRLKDIEVSFFNAGGVLFGVDAYVPALQSYMDRYGVNCQYQHKLTKVNGPNRVATFHNGNTDVEAEFDMLHVCPPQVAPQFVAESKLANAEGWVDVDQHTLQHTAYPNVFSLGDVASTPNAKTAAAVRKQAPVLASNLCAHLNQKDPHASYDGYGSCPLTVEAGKVILAEFGYGGKLLPSIPTWMFDGTKPTRRAWNLKATWLPPIYFDLMLKGREWLAQPNQLTSTPTQTALEKS